MTEPKPERPVVPKITSIDMKDAEQMRAWREAHRAAFIWDAAQAGFSAEAAAFLYERYGERSRLLGMF